VRFYDLNRQPIICPICKTIYALVPATTVRAYQGPAKRHVAESDHAEADAAAGGDAHSQMEVEKEPAAGEDDVILIEDIEEDSADVSDKSLVCRPKPDEKP
jgi:hypothetical protein